MPTESSAVRRAIIYSLLMVLCASTAAVATKYAAAGTSVEAIVTVQFLVCLLLGLPVVWRHGRGNLRTGRPLLHFFRGAAGVLGFYLFYAALDNIPMVDALLLRQSAPLCVPVVAWLWSRERVSPVQWLPILTGFVGVILILRPQAGGISWWHAAGFGSAVALAASMVATHSLARTEPPFRILFYYFVLSLACVAPFSVGDLAAVGWREWLAMGYVGVSMYIALELYTRAYGLAPAARIAPITYFGVVLGGFWGWLFWDQVPDAVSLFGSALVIAGGLLTLYLAGGTTVEREALSP